MIRLSLTLAGLAICNAVLAVLMPWYIVTRLGVGFATDAFFASGALPQLIFLVASFSLTQVLVPLLEQHDVRHGSEGRIPALTEGAQNMGIWSGSLL